MDFKFSEEDEAFRQDFRKLAGEKPAARLARRGRGARRRNQVGIRTPPRLASQAVRRRLDVYPLAQGVRRTRRDPAPAGHLQPGTRARQGAAHGQFPGYRAGRSDPDAVGNPGTEDALHPEDSARRGDLVPGTIGAQSRLGPRRGRNPRGRRGRPLRRQRLENLDFQCPRRRLQHPAVPHRSRTHPSIAGSATCWSI